MWRTTLLFSALALPCLAGACTSNAGQNGLKELPDGYIPIPSYEASPVQEFDGSVEGGDGSDDVSSDAPIDAHLEAAREAATDAPPPDVAADAPHDGAGPG